MSYCINFFKYLVIFFSLILLFSIKLFIFFYKKIVRLVASPFELPLYFLNCLLGFISLRLFKTRAFNTLFFFIFFSIPTYLITFFFGFCFFFCLVVVVFPFFLLRLLCLSLWLVWRGLFLGSLSYIYVFCYLTRSVFNFLFSYTIAFGFRFLLFSLKILDSILLFILFLLDLFYIFLNFIKYSNKFVFKFFPSAFSIFKGYGDSQFGYLSNNQVSSTVLKSDYFSLEPSFFVNLPESLTVEVLQIQELMSNYDVSDHRFGSADSFLYFQILKQHKFVLPLINSRPISSNLMFLNLYVLDDFLNVDSSYRHSWLKRNLPFSLPKKYEYYIFNRYLKVGLLTILNYFNFISPSVTASKQFFKRFLYYSQGGFFRLHNYLLDGSFYFSNSEEIIDPYHPFLNQFDFMFEFSDEIEEENLSNPLARPNSVSGFHYNQLVDDGGFFSKPMTYDRPKTDRYWFKRALSPDLFSVKGFSGIGLGFLSQLYFFVSDIFAFILAFFYFILTSVIFFFRTISSVILRLSLLFPIFGKLREFFFLILNFFFKPRPAFEFKFSFPSFSVLSFYYFSLYRISLFVLWVYQLLASVRFFLFFLIYPFVYCFNFFQFLYKMHLNGKLPELVYNEFRYLIRFYLKIK